MPNTGREKMLKSSAQRITQRRKESLIDQIIENPVYTQDSYMVKMLKTKLLTLSEDVLTSLLLVIKFKEPETS